MGFRDEIKQRNKEINKNEQDLGAKYNSKSANRDSADYRMDVKVVDSVIDYIKDIFKYKIDRVDFYNDGLWGKFYCVNLEMQVYLDDRGVFPDLEITRGKPYSRINNCDGSINLTFHNIDDLDRILTMIVSQAKSEFDEIGNMGVDVKGKTLWTDRIISNFVKNIKNNVNYEFVYGMIPANTRSKSYVRARFVSRVFCNRKGVIK